MNLCAISRHARVCCTLVAAHGRRRMTNTAPVTMMIVGALHPIGLDIVIFLWLQAHVAQRAKRRKKLQTFQIERVVRISHIAQRWNEHRNRRRGFPNRGPHEEWNVVRGIVGRAEVNRIYATAKIAWNEELKALRPPCILQIVIVEMDRVVLTRRLQEGIGPRSPIMSGDHTRRPVDGISVEAVAADIGDASSGRIMRKIPARRAFLAEARKQIIGCNVPDFLGRQRPREQRWTAQLAVVAVDCVGDDAFP